MNPSLVALLFVFTYTARIVVGIQDYCSPGYRPDGMHYEFDLSPMDREFMMERQSFTKPSMKITRTTINICNPVLKPPITYDEDFCKPNTYVCLRLYHRRGDVERLDEVEELAGDYESSKLSPEFKAVTGNQDLSSEGGMVSLILHGEKLEDKMQTVEIILECGPNESKDNPKGPRLISDDNYLTKLHWKVAFACATKTSQPGGEDSKTPQHDSQSIIGWLFIIFCVLLVVYFIIGIIYSYKILDARGLDLIPHCDFFLDLPYLTRDIVSHLVGAVTSRRRRKNGYVSV